MSGASTARRARPLAVAIGGPPGSGKTTLATALAPALGAALLDLDVATGPLTDVVLTLLGVPDLDDARAAAATREPRYRTLFDLAADSARAGTPTVLVAPFAAERDAGTWAAATHSLASIADVRLVWMVISPNQLGSRLSARGATRDATKLLDPAGWAAGFDATSPRAAHLALDAQRPVPELLRDVLAYLAVPS